MQRPALDSHDEFDRTYRPFGPPPEAQESRPPSKTDARAVVTRKDGRKRRRMTVYLPPELAKRLAVHCATEEVEMSTVMAEALQRHLRAPAGA